MISSPVVAKRLVGRDAERAFFDARLAAAQRNEGSMILLFGEPGIGKTRILREWTASAVARGFASVIASNFEYAGSAFAPAAEALQSLVAEIDPCDEPARELAIRAHMCLGDRASAIREFRSYQRRVDEELGLQPSIELRRLLDERLDVAPIHAFA
jgi:predicted ATPase